MDRFRFDSQCFLGFKHVDRHFDFSGPRGSTGEKRGLFFFLFPFRREILFLLKAIGINIFLAFLPIHFLVVTPKDLFFCPLAFFFLPHFLVDIVNLFQQPKDLLIFFFILRLDPIVFLRLIVGELNDFISNTLTTFL